MHPPLPQDFNPYRDWLGIALEEQPPHHYRLLDLKLFEVHPGSISAAADRQAKLLKDNLHGPRADIAQRLLAELEAAKACLFNPGAKQAYDAQLVRQLAPPDAAPTQPHPGLATGNAGGVMTPRAFLPMGTMVEQGGPAADTVTSLDATSTSLTVDPPDAPPPPPAPRKVRRRRRNEPSVLSHMIGVVGGGVIGIYAAAAFLNYMQVPLPDVVHVFPGLAPAEPKAKPAKLDPVEVELDPVEVVSVPQTRPPIRREPVLPTPPIKSDAVATTTPAPKSNPPAAPTLSPAQRQDEILRQHQAAQTAAEFRAVALACLETCEQAAADGDTRLALRLLTTGLAAARKSDDSELVKQVTLRILELQKQQK